jgi:hypothetical protein
MSVMRLPVFQMKLGLDAASRPGWLLADEGPDDAASIAFTIPFLPGHPFDQVELSLAGERNGQFEEFTLRFNGYVFVEPGTGVRFSLHDPFAPADFRGIPFMHSFSYIGSGGETLGQYGVSPTAPFLELSPLDLDRMDPLFLENKLVFAGTTQSFGLHRQTGFQNRRQEPGVSFPRKRARFQPEPLPETGSR